jgi:hypothetical protein
MLSSIRATGFRFAVSGILLSAVAFAMLALAPVLTPAFTTAANAQDARDEEQRACSRDVSRHCRKLMNEGDMVIFQCLQQNRDKLSPSCRKVVESH